MKVTILIIFVLFGLLQTGNCDKKKMQNTDDMASPTPKQTTKFDRLPENIKPETEVRKDIKNEQGEVVSVEVTTVEKRLNELKARYEKDKLVDGKGREIRFFEPLCRGVSQGLEEDQKAQEEKDKELAGLQKKYTVIILYCDPRKAL
jgi:hypothetical protein